MLLLIGVRGAGDEYRATLVVETQLAFHFPTVPHGGGVNRGCFSYGCLTPPISPGAVTGHNGAMQTDTIERTDSDERVDDGSDDDRPKHFHYVKKNKIAESAVMGTHVVALCGEVFPVTRSAKPGSPVCPDCKRIYESLKKG